MHQLFKNLFFVILVGSIFSSCNRKDNPAIQSNNWQTIYQNGDLDLYSIKFLDKDNGFVFGGLTAYTRPYWQVLLTTNDGGNHWSSDTCKLTAMIYGGIFPLSKEKILGVGDHVFKSSNTGETWTDLTAQLPVGSRTFGSYIIDSLTWIFTRSGEIYRTINAGQTWQMDYNISSGAIYENFTFPSSLVGYTSTGGIVMDFTVGPGGSSGAILKTSDGGQNWTILNPEPWKSNGSTMPYLNALQFITDQIGYYSDGVTVYVTNDGGKTWTVDNYNNTQGADILYWTFLETGQGYALTRDHRILKNNF